MDEEHDRISELHNALKNDPKNWATHFNLGIIYSKQGDRLPACKSFWHALILHISLDTFYGFLKSLMDFSPRLTAILITILFIFPFIIKRPIGLVFTILLITPLIILTYVNFKSKNIKQAIIGIIVGILMLYWHIFTVFHE